MRRKARIPHWSPAGRSAPCRSLSRPCAAAGDSSSATSSRSYGREDELSRGDPPEARRERERGSAWGRGAPADTPDPHASPPREARAEAGEPATAQLREPTRGSVAPASFRGGSALGSPKAEYGTSRRPAREQESGGDPETKWLTRSATIELTSCGERDAHRPASAARTSPAGVPGVAESAPRASAHGKLPPGLLLPLGPPCPGLAEQWDGLGGSRAPSAEPRASAAQADRRCPGLDPAARASAPPRAATWTRPRAPPRGTKGPEFRASRPPPAVTCRPGSASNLPD